MSFSIFRIVPLLVGGIVGGLVVYWVQLGSHFPSTLADWADLSQPVVALMATFAAFAYFYQIQKDSSDAASSQISFYRKELVPAFKKLGDDTRAFLKIDHTQRLPEIKQIPDFSLEWIRSNPDRKKVADEQNKPYEQSKTLNDHLITCLNLLEEFSRSVLTKKTYDQPALASVRPGFVEAVEATASIVATYMYVNNDMYRGIKGLYEIWSKQVDRDTLKDKIEKTKQKLSQNKQGSQSPAG